MKSPAVTFCNSNETGAWQTQKKSFGASTRTIFVAKITNFM